MVWSPGQGREPINRQGAARYRPAIAAYSLRRHFTHFRGRAQQPADGGPQLDLFGFIDYCASHHCDAELTSYFVPPEAGDDYLLRLKAHAFTSGTVISGTAIGNNFTVDAGEPLEQEIAHTEDWIRKSALLGAPHLRIFAGTARQLGDSDEKLQTVCNAVDRCARTAAEYGVFLGIENHGRISSDQLLTILDRVESDWVGINLDTGNFVGQDPYDDIRRCAPWAVNVQLKTHIKKTADGAVPADFDRIASILSDSGYQGYIALEYEDDSPYEQIPPLVRRMRDAFDM